MLLDLSVIVRVALEDDRYHGYVAYGHVENWKGNAAHDCQAKKGGTTDAWERDFTDFLERIGEFR